MEGTRNCVGSTKSLEEIIYWTHFQFIHFTLFLSITHFHHQLALPKTFSDNLKKKLPANVTLKGPSEIVWNIGLTTRGDTIYFTNGWQKFVKDHSLKQNDFLVFKYNGESQFEVLIFNGNTFCEKAASYFVQKCGQAHSPSSGGVEYSSPEKLWAEDIYWSYFKFTHFTLLLHTNFERQLALPKTFSDNLNKKLPENVTLKGPSGVTWNIRLTTRDGTVYFVDGWQQFMNDHSLKANDFLVCKYNGESHFEVLIFDGESFCEKEASYFVEKCGHAQTAQGGSNASQTNNSVEEVNTASNAGDSPEQFTDDAVPKTAAIQCPFLPTGKRTKRRRRSPKAANWGARAHAWVTCNKQHPEAASPNRSGKVDDHCIYSGASLSKSTALVEEKIAQSFSSSFPYFVKIIKAFNVSGSRTINIPHQFSTAHLPNSDTPIFLQNLKGEHWLVNSVTKTKIHTSHSLCGGWMDFVRGNSIKVGDVCIFELVQECEFRVRIIAEVGKDGLVLPR